MSWEQLSGTYDDKVAGMTLRQWYAGLAMQSLVSLYPNTIRDEGAGAASEHISKSAILLSDALLAALEAGG